MPKPTVRHRLRNKDDRSFNIKQALQDYYEDREYEEWLEEMESYED
jgi:hypothetical protein